ncbi:MAG: YciI family protein [Anaerolineales bacterium]
MQYLCLIYYDEKKLEAMPESERNAMYEEAYAYYDGLVKNGHGIAGDALQSVQSAKSVRIQKGKTFITDGPYVETKEQVGGYILMEAKDLAQAIRLASDIPPARMGGVEVRPVWNMAGR